MKVVRIIQALGVGALMVAASAAAAEEDGVAMKNLLGAMGIIPKEKPPIEYRERPPLVVPPKLDLPPPVASGAAQPRVANWPQDPDVVARRREAAEARRVRPENSVLSPAEMQSAMTPAQMEAARRAPRAPVPINPENTVLTPDQMRASDPRRASAEPLVPGAEPTRTTLTEPPTGYRKPAAGAPLRASVDPQEPDWESPEAFRRQQQRR